MQRDETLIKILQYETSKLHFLLNLNIKKLVYLVELNILAIIEGLFNIQSKLPFAFLSFLQHYLETIIQLLLLNKFEEEKLINALVQANTKPFLIFAYYMDEK